MALFISTSHFGLNGLVAGFFASAGCSFPPLVDLWSLPPWTGQGFSYGRLPLPFLPPGRLIVFFDNQRFSKNNQSTPNSFSLPPLNVLGLEFFFPFLVRRLHPDHSCAQFSFLFKCTSRTNGTTFWVAGGPPLLAEVSLERSDLFPTPPPPSPPFLRSDNRYVFLSP